MILNQFPNLEWLKKQAHNSFADRKDAKGQTLDKKGWPNVILNVNAGETYRDNIKGPLSIFTNLCGESYVEVDNKTTLIKPGFFYITNQEQLYTLGIEKQKAETFNIHFGQDFAEQIFLSLSKTTEYLLDNNDLTERPGAVRFHNRLSQRDTEFENIIASLKSEHSKVKIEEHLFTLIKILLTKEKAYSKSLNRISTVRSITKAEIVRKMTTAKDFIYSNYDKNFSIEDVASASCMSKFHFLRLFKEAFGITPGEFIDDLRISKAKETLKNTTLDVHELAKSLGYENSSSFSRMFFRKVGAYPTQYRHS
jgi:AraC family transcriptional regulator